MQYCAFTSTVCACGDCMLNEEEVNSAHVSDVENGFVAGVIKKKYFPIVADYPDLLKRQPPI